MTQAVHPDFVHGEVVDIIIRGARYEGRDNAEHAFFADGYAFTLPLDIEGPDLSMTIERAATAVPEEPGNTDTGDTKQRRRITDDFLRQVAEDYRAAEAACAPAIVKSIAEKYSAAYSSAQRWIAAARRRGYLSPALVPGGLEDGQAPRGHVTPAELGRAVGATVAIAKQVKAEYVAGVIEGHAAATAADDGAPGSAEALWAFLDRGVPVPRLVFNAGVREGLDAVVAAADRTGNGRAALDPPPPGKVYVGQVQIGTRLVSDRDPRGYVEVGAIDDQLSYGHRELWYTGATEGDGLTPVDELLTEYTGPEVTKEAVAVITGLEALTAFLRTNPELADDLKTDLKDLFSSAIIDLPSPGAAIDRWIAAARAAGLEVEPWRNDHTKGEGARIKFSPAVTVRRGAHEGMDGWTFPAEDGEDRPC